MRVLRNILLTIILVGVAGGGAYFAHEYGYISGETAGYTTGYAAGEEYGYESGNEDGYALGYTDGEEAGYDSGYTLGSETGYTSGYEVGTATGYNYGFSEGQTTGYETGHLTGYSEGIEDGAGQGYTIRNPTYAEALAFLRVDRTDRNEYLVEESTGTGYVCSHYARDVVNNAELAGYRAAFVEIRHPDSGHAIIAFETIDRGLIFFEPQSDEVVEPIIGKRYYQCVIPAAGTYYTAPEYDDTIMDILVIW